MRTVTELAGDLLELLAEDDPLNELMQGFPGCAGKLGDPDEAAQQRLRGGALAIAEEARALNPAGEERTTRDVIIQQADALVTKVDARLVEHTVLDFLVAPVPRLLFHLPAIELAGEQQEREYLTRLAGIPRYLAASATRHRDGLAVGRLPVAGRVRDALTRLDDYLDDPAADPLRRPAVSGRRVADRDQLLTDAVRPAFAAYREVLAELEPHGRPDDRPGLCWLAGGEATYATLARMHTTTERTAEELHRTGRELLDRLDEEFASIGSAAFGVPTAAEVKHRMRTDPALRWRDAEQVLTTARATIERAERAAPAWFGRLPEQRCRVEATPRDKEAHSSAAYYLPGPVDGSRAGSYFANTYLATERDVSTAEANAFHEAVPGHHVQITIAQGLTSLPELRRLAWINSYMEGWALYCERLADEMGLYSGDVARLGMLGNDAMRAARLVVDTGLHAFGWSRDQVVDFLRTRTVMSEVEIQAETNRYIEAPGQALSYMVGRLEIERLRRDAERKLGAAFDIKAFHDVVLGSGPLPMTVLGDVVAGWAAA